MSVQLKAGKHPGALYVLFVFFKPNISTLYIWAFLYTFFKINIAYVR